MTTWNFTRLTLFIATVLTIAAAPSAFAQSAIAGIVRDSSGGVLPGATVEAASASLIEGTRTAVTDNDGGYKIANLRPGVYAVTFTLAGFRSSSRRSTSTTCSTTTR